MLILLLTCCHCKNTALDDSSDSEDLDSQGADLFAIPKTANTKPPAQSDHHRSKRRATVQEVLGYLEADDLEIDELREVKATLENDQKAAQKRLAREEASHKSEVMVLNNKLRYAEMETFGQSAALTAEKLKVARMEKVVKVAKMVADHSANIRLETYLQLMVELKDAVAALGEKETTTE